MTGAEKEEFSIVSLYSSFDVGRSMSDVQYGGSRNLGTGNCRYCWTFSPRIQTHRLLVGGCLDSNPNNPAWFCFTEQELQIIGELATKYDCVVMEDLAYFGMDFRKDYSIPGQSPYIPSVAKYTDHYILLISSSKSFSLAGQRIGMTAISDKLFNSKGNNLEQYFGSNNFGYAYIFGAMYALSSGVSHSNQWGLTGLLKAVNKGDYNFLESVREYGDRAKAMKKLQMDFILLFHIQGLAVSG